MSATVTPAASTKRQVPEYATLLIACLAQFMVVLDVSIVNVALPSMKISLGMSATSLSWVVNAYTLAFAGFLLFGGRAADLFGRKRVFLTGLAVFTVASLLGGLSHNATEITMARALQGLGGAILAPATLSLLTTTYTEPHERSRALGAWSATAASGGAFGVLVGGILTSALSWRWVLFVNVPIGILLFIAARWALVESRGQATGWASLDLPGTLTITAGLTSIVYGVVTTDQHAWGSAHTLGFIGAGIALIAIFLLIEARSAQPLVPLRIFRLRSLRSANVVALGIGAAIFAMFFFVSLYLQDVLGASALRAGIEFLPACVAIIGGSVVGVRAIGRVGPRPLLAAGTIFAAVGLLLLTRMSSGGSYATVILGPIMLIGLGMGMCFVPMTMAATAGVKPQEAGLASGLINTNRQIGGALGLAILTSIAYSRAHAVLAASTSMSAEAVRLASAAGFARAMAVAALFIAGAFVAALTIPALPTHSPAHAESEPVVELA
jgi:EmrB/QacA subfamily drug resistance transporter